MPAGYQGALCIDRVHVYPRLFIDLVISTRNDLVTHAHDQFLPCFSVTRIRPFPLYIIFIAGNYSLYLTSCAGRFARWSVTEERSRRWGPTLFSLPFVELNVDSIRLILILVSIPMVNLIWSMDGWIMVKDVSYNKTIFFLRSFI